ncbi:hypothetical protein IWW55_002186 [Coemansia sp. RSA 2706]|nr:hypothetical protein IWW55_002186 [Coemansia sp. RSA 2706]
MPAALAARQRSWHGIREIAAGAEFERPQGPRGSERALRAQICLPQRKNAGYEA